MEYPHEAVMSVGPEGDLEDDTGMQLAQVLGQLADYARWAKDRVACVEAIAEGLRSEEWTQGHIEVIASLTKHVADIDGRNEFGSEGEQRTGANVVIGGQDWGCR